MLIGIEKLMKTWILNHEIDLRYLVITTKIIVKDIFTKYQELYYTEFIKVFELRIELENIG